MQNRLSTPEELEILRNPIDPYLHVIGREETAW
jgi:hypothetical protein